MTTNMRIETPFPFCPLCEHIKPIEINIFGVQDMAKYHCEHYRLCEDVVSLYKSFNEEKKEKNK